MGCVTRTSSAASVGTPAGVDSRHSATTYRGACGRSGRPLVASVAAQPGTTAERFWPQWRGPHATGASRTANPPTEWSETQERSLEGRNPWSRLGLTGGVGRSAVPAFRRPDGRSGRRVARAQRSHPASRHPSVHRPGDRPSHRTRCLGANRPRREPSPALDEGRHLGVEFCHHRRSTRLRLLRIERPVRLRHGRQPAVAEASRREEDVCRRGRIGKHSCSARQPSGDRVGPSRRVLCRGARRPDRTGGLASRSPGSRFVEHASRGGARRPLSGRDDRAEPHQKLRPRDGQGRLGERGLDDEPDSLSRGLRTGWSSR